MRRIPMALPVLLALLVGGCEEDGERELPPPDQTYTARGRLEQAPAQGKKGDLVIHHERIAEFVDGEGEKVGMEAMVMPFAPADGLSLEGVQKGDPIEFTFEVRWGGDPMLRVTEVRKLPADTELELGDE
ncbi:MAG: copper-binding protein [Myxococcota bacterium]